MADSKHPTTITALYSTASAYTPLQSCDMKDQTLAKLQAAIAELKPGDRIQVRILGEETRRKFPGYPDTAPTAMLEIETAEQRAAWKARLAEKRTGFLAPKPAPTPAPEPVQGEFDF